MQEKLTIDGSANLMSRAVSSLVMPPPVKSIISTLKSSPFRTSATGGISGCHRLWRGSFCCHGFFFTSIGTTTLQPQVPMTGLFFLSLCLFDRCVVKGKMKCTKNYSLIDIFLRWKWPPWSSFTRLTIFLKRKLIDTWTIYYLFTFSWTRYLIIIFNNRFFFSLKIVSWQ